MPQTFRRRPGKLDIEFHRGDHVRVEVRVRRNIGTATEPTYQDVDFTDIDLRAQVRRRARSDEVITTFDVEKINAAEGRIALVLPAERSALIHKASAYDVEGTPATGPDEGQVRTWVEGSVDPSLDVTRGEPSDENE